METQWTPGPWTLGPWTPGPWTPGPWTLIAAAPEMAAMLERFVTCVVTRNDLEDGVARDARALLAKIKKGE